MSCQFLTMLFLASLAQEKKAWRPIPAAPSGSRTVHVGVRVAGHLETRQITISTPPPADEDEAPVARRDIRSNIMMGIVDAENFDRWLFADEQSEADRRRHLDDILLTKLNAATKAHNLTESQRAKLRLAGRGDIKRFFDRVEDTRREFEKDRQNFRTGFAALQRLEPLTQVYRDGAFDDGSLFAKTLSKINDDQKPVRQDARTSYSKSVGPAR
jgi:hypothetical protein